MAVKGYSVLACATPHRGSRWARLPPAYGDTPSCPAWRGFIASSAHA